MTSDTDQPTEIEIALGNDTELDLNRIDIDSENLPLKFSVDGVIRDIDSDIMGELQGKELEPIAIRFRLQEHNDEQQ